jgi:hypothetical protein
LHDLKALLSRSSNPEEDWKKGPKTQNPKSDNAGFIIVSMSLVQSLMCAPCGMPKRIGKKTQNPKP